MPGQDVPDAPETKVSQQERAALLEMAEALNRLATKFDQEELKLSSNRAVRPGEEPLSK